MLQSINQRKFLVSADLHKRQFHFFFFFFSVPLLCWLFVKICIVCAYMTKIADLRCNFKNKLFDRISLDLFTDLLFYSILIEFNAFWASFYTVVNFLCRQFHKLKFTSLSLFIWSFVHFILIEIFFSLRGLTKFQRNWHQVMKWAHCSSLTCAQIEYVNGS